MKRLRAYKTKLRLNNKERGWCERCAGAARWCYNRGLRQMIDAHEEGRKTSAWKERSRLTATQDDIAPWLREVPYKVLEGAFDHLAAAYSNFFRRVKGGAKEKGFPKFKDRGRSVSSFTLRGDSILITETHIKLPNARHCPPRKRVGPLRLAEHGYLPTSNRARILSATVSERGGDWFVSVQVEEEVAEPEAATGPPIGVDLGIHALAVVSDGTRYENIKPLATAHRKIRRLNKELARRTKGGANWRKTKAQLNKAHTKVRHLREHYLHEISAGIIGKGPCALGLEKLNVKGMQQNRHIARAIADLGMYELRRQLTYKANWNGTELVLVDTWYPSSKTCSECGHVRESLPLDEREFICPECGLVIDRDLNAALNLAAMAAQAVDIANRQNRRGLPGELARGKRHCEPGRGLQLVA